MSVVDAYFPPSAGVSIIAEPGSYFVSSAFTLAVNVISKEVVARDRQDQAHGQCLLFIFKHCSLAVYSEEYYVWEFPVPETVRLFHSPAKENHIDVQLTEVKIKDFIKRGF